MTTPAELRAQAARLLDEAATADGLETVRALFAHDPDAHFPGSRIAPPAESRRPTSTNVRDLFAPDPDQAFPTRTTEEN